MISPSPAKFELGKLEISSDEVEIDEEVMISLLVTNTGDLSGDYEVTLRINYRMVEERTITLDGGDSTNISFNFAPNSAGTYTVNINELTGTFTVRAPEETEPEPEPEIPTDSETLPEPEAPPTTVTTIEPETPEITQETGSQPTVDEQTDTDIEFRWWIFAVLIAIVVVMGTALLLVIRSQKS